MSRNRPQSGPHSPPRAAMVRNSARRLLPLFLSWLVIGVSAPATAATVVLDTGHTPQRPGSRSPDGRQEYHYNLTLSNDVARRLMAKGVTVIRVGADGRDIALAERTIHTGQANLFVSIHHDSIPQAWIDAGRRQEFAGFSVFVSGKNPVPAPSYRCARLVGASLAAVGERPSHYHATPMKGEGRPLLDADFGVHRFDDLVVLKTAQTPALLVEAGVIANPVEARRLALPATIQRLGYAIAESIAQCLE